MCMQEDVWSPHLLNMQKLALIEVFQLLAHLWWVARYITSLMQGSVYILVIE